MGDFNELNFVRRFRKLGFYEKDSEIEEELNIRKLRERLNEIEFGDLDKISLPKKSLMQVKSMSRKLLQKVLKNVSFMVDSFENETAPEFTQKTPFFRLREISYMANLGSLPCEEVMKKTLETYAAYSKRINVFDVPVIGVPDKKAMMGYCLKGPSVIVDDNEFLMKAPVYAEAIYLGTKHISLLSVGSYVHEIIHLLTDRHKRVVKNYYNDELLPIFMEKLAVYSFDENITKLSEVYRLEAVREDINRIKSENELEDADKFKYAQSSLYAGILFHKYISADEQGKEKIMSTIREILNGRKEVKDLIAEQGLTLTEENVFSYIDKVAGYSKELRRRSFDKCD